MNKIFILLILFLNVNLLTAQDLILTSFASYNSANNNGELLIEIDPSITDFPFTIEVTGPNGYSHLDLINNHSLLLTGLRSGTYTVTLITANGCTTTVSVEVKRCTKKGNKFFCHIVAEPCCDVKVAALPFDGGNFTASDLSLDFYHGLPPVEYAQIEGVIYQQTIDIIDEVIRYGYTRLEVPEQDDVEGDPMFVLSFDSRGELQWVYHNYEGGDDVGKERGEEQAAGMIAFSGNLKAYPNPADQEVTCKFESPEAGIATLELVDVLGQVVLREEINVVQGLNTHRLHNLQKVPDGVLFLNLQNTGNSISSERLFIQHWK